MRALAVAVLMIVMTGSAWACPPNSRCIGKILSPEEQAARQREVQAWVAKEAARERAAASGRTKEKSPFSMEAARTRVRRPNVRIPCTDAQWWDGKTDCMGDGY